MPCHVKFAKFPLSKLETTKGCQTDFIGTRDRRTFFCEYLGVFPYIVCLICMTFFTVYDLSHSNTHQLEITDGTYRVVDS